MKMPKVKKCEVSDCAYNSEDLCHALAITVGGDEAHPRCDTFWHSTTKGGDVNSVAGVGACKVTACMFNNSLECRAPGIMVGYQQNEVDCLTFKSK